MGDESPNLRPQSEPEPSSEATPKTGDATPMPGDLPLAVGESHIFHEAPFFAAQPSLIPPAETPATQPASDSAVATVPAPAPADLAAPAEVHPDFALTMISTPADSLAEYVANAAAASMAPTEPGATTSSPETAAPIEAAREPAAAATESAPALSEPAAESTDEATPIWTGFQIDTEGESSDESPSEAEEEAEQGELPPPLERTGSIPILASELSLLMALFVGIAMVAAQRMLYLPLLYSIALGMLLGWALSRAAHRGCTNRLILGSLTLVAVLLAQGTYHVGNFLWDNHRSTLRRLDLPELLDLATWDDVERFGRYMQDQARQKKVFGFSLGPYGYYVLSSCEAFLMFMFAWLPVRSARRLKLAASVPVEVLERVIALRRQKLDRSEVFLKLSEQGWISPREQQQAWDAADAYLALVARRKRR
jgi:hypothetical protein